MEKTDALKELKELEKLCIRECYKTKNGRKIQHKDKTVTKKESRKTGLRLNETEFKTISTIQF